MAAWRVLKVVLAVFAGTFALGLAACDSKPQAKARQPGPLRIVVTIPPLAGLVKPLAPEGADVRTLMAPGRSEHGVEFTAEDLTYLGKADVVVFVGLMLEPKVEQFLAEHPDPNRQVVNFAASVGLVSPDDHDHAEHEGHDHKDEPQAHNHDHAHGPEDPHLWLDPVLVAQFIPAARSAVQTALKAQGVDDAKRLEPLERELISQVLKVDDEYRAALTPHQGKGIVTHHAAWSRLAERYGLKVAEVLRPVESSEPDAAHLAKIVDALKAAQTPVIFIEPAYDRRSAERIAGAANARVLTMDPLGTGDWFAMMRSNLAALKDAFAPPTPPTTPPSTPALPATP